MSSELLPAVPVPQRASNVNISSHYTLKSAYIFDCYTSSLFFKSNEMSNAVGDLIHVYIPNTSESQEIPISCQLCLLLMFISEVYVENFIFFVCLGEVEQS